MQGFMTKILKSAWHKIMPESRTLLHVASALREYLSQVSLYSAKEHLFISLVK